MYVLRGGGGNTAVFITAKGVVLVDTKIAGWGQPIIGRVKELTDKPVTMIINTHTHYDHTEGNVEFPATVEVVTHENTAKLMPEMRAVYGGQTTGAGRNVFRDSKGRGLPKRTFTDRMTLGSGSDRIELHYFGRAHTNGDAFIVFPSLRILHTGDAFPNKGMPIMDLNNNGSGVEYADTIAKAAGLPNIDTVITGHNATTLNILDVKMYSEFIREFVNDVRAAKKGGRTIDDVARTWKVPGRFAAAGYAQPPEARLRSNVEVVWKELN
jgi:glyoxylase-like metal-dependent hydrolase (beta-lactamase superfamily II)